MDCISWQRIGVGLVLDQFGRALRESSLEHHCIALHIGFLILCFLLCEWALSQGIVDQWKHEGERRSVAMSYLHGNGIADGS